MVIGGFAVAFYLFYLFLLSPLWDTITKTNSEIRALQTELKTAEQRVQALKEIEAKFGNLPEKSIVPHEKRSLAILKDLSQATTKSKLTLLSIQPLPSDGTEGFKFNLSASGSYRNLYDFFVMLHRSQRMIFVDNLEATKGEESGINVKLLLTAYY